MITNAEKSDRTDELFHILFPFWPSMFTEKYTVLRQIYSANSNVYLVKNTDNNQIYVAKTFNEDCIWLWYRERNGNTIPMEIHVMEKLKGEQIINIVDHYYFFGNDHYYFSGQDANYYTIVMEYLGDDWCDLFEFLQHRPLSEYQALSIFKNILKGLIKIHQKGISHTDLKVENIMIDKNSFEIRIIDFGSARPRRSRATEFCGTHKSPEIINGDKWCPVAYDSWSLGVVLFRLLFGRLPFAYNEQEILQRDISEVLKEQHLPVSGSTAAVLSRLLDKDPKKRPNLDETLYLLGVFQRLMAKLKVYYKKAAVTVKRIAKFVRKVGKDMNL